MENCSALLLLAAALMVGVSSKIDDQLGSCFMTAKSRVVMHRFCLILKALKWYPPGISVSESEKIKQIKTVLEAERPGQRFQTSSDSVHRIAPDQNYFFQVFSSAFVRLSSTNVLNEAKGEVRRICNRVNE
ncbi:hypothetical protein ACOSQ3_013057 [Xanthoceras sorbifolium]